MTHSPGKRFPGRPSGALFSYFSYVIFLMQDTGDSYDTQLQSFCRVAVSKKSKNERQLGSFFICAGQRGQP
jgi:hypothetical protein